MNAFVVLLICIEATLIQNVFSQYPGSHGVEEISNIIHGYSSGLGGIAPAAVSSSFGGRGAGVYNGGRGNHVKNTGVNGLETPKGATYETAGEGNVVIAGNLPVNGNAAILGQVPMTGMVNFAGNVPATGSVIISGRCSCGCDIF